jgi:hypothetical protein
MAGAVFLGVAAAIAGCGGSNSKTSTTPAASAAATTKVAATTPSATKSSGTTPAAAAPTSASAANSGGGDTCKYLSADEASALLANPGAARVTSADTSAAKQTTCSWGVGTTNRIMLVANDFKISAAVGAIKTKMDTELVEKVDGLGDVGGFQTKDADAVTVVFLKGNMQIALAVSATGVNADAVLAAAKKIAAGL